LVTTGNIDLDPATNLLMLGAAGVTAFGTSAAGFGTKVGDLRTALVGGTGITDTINISNKLATLVAKRFLLVE